MKKLFIDHKNIDQAAIKAVAQSILNGALVAIPTETVYGLAVSAEEKKAIKRLYEIKKRPSQSPLTMALPDANKAINEYFAVLPPFGYRLIEKFWPGPLTIIYHNRKDEKIGIRVPSDVILKQLLGEIGTGLYLTSANISGQKEAVSAQEVEAVFNGNLDVIIDAGPAAYSRPSTVIDLAIFPFKILREGVVSEKDIIDVFIKKRIMFVCTGNSCRSPMAQFLLEKYLNENKPYMVGRHEIISRGISTLAGMPASAHTVEILKEKEGVNISGFASQRINRSNILSSDLIFTMEDVHTDYILKLEPTAEGRVFGLKKFLPSKLEKDIPDPIGSDISVYEQVYAIIKKAVLELTEWL
jgi:protein-tyrosine phosphatase